MGVLRAIDERMLRWTQKWYLDLYGKPKILSLAAMLLTFGLVIENSTRSPFVWIFLSLFLFSSFLFVYEKREWHRLRNKGAREAEGLFFEESAHPLRKWAFLIACVFLFLRKILLPDYSVDSFIYGYGLNKHITFMIFNMMFVSIFLVELLRVVVPSSPSWSNKKHFIIVLSLSVISIVMNFAVLYHSGFLGSVMF